MPRRKGTRKRKSAPKRRKKFMKNKIMRPRTLLIKSGSSIKVNLRKIEVVNQNSSFATHNMTFKLDDFQLYSAWTNLFESYRILFISQVIYPQADAYIAPVTQVGITTNDPDAYLDTQPNHPLLLTRVERDGDGSNPTDIDDALKNPAYKIQSLKKVRAIKYKPNILGQNYVSAISTGYNSEYDKWISTSDSTVVHYGRRRCVSVPGADSAQPFVYRIITSAIVEFKNLKYDENN